MKIERSCVICRKKDEKSNLVRMTKNDNEVQLDFEQRSDGRGFYVCKTPECIARLAKHKKYAIKQEMAEEILKNMRSTPNKL
ncbi:MAG: YlxR family protein [Fusobacteria bacterium]|nr:YlxR family protein [Fusobacteriota bacterium]